MTTAVKVTDWPNTEGFTEEVTVVVDAAATTLTIPVSTTTKLSVTAKETGTIDVRTDLNRTAGSLKSQVAISPAAYPNRSNRDRRGPL